MSDLTPEREAEIRHYVASCLDPESAMMYTTAAGSRAVLMLLDTLNAFAAERVARAAAEKERDQLRKAIARITKTPVYEKRGEPASGISLAMIRAIREAAESAGLEPWVSHRDPLAAAASKEPAA